MYRHRFLRLEAQNDGLYWKLSASILPRDTATDCNEAWIWDMVFPYRLSPRLILDDDVWPFISGRPTGNVPHGVVYFRVSGHSCQAIPSILYGLLLGRFGPEWEELWQYIVWNSNAISVRTAAVEEHTPICCAQHKCKSRCVPWEYSQTWPLPALCALTAEYWSYLLIQRKINLLP